MQKILMIDDDVNFCKLITYQLKRQGFEVDSANNGTDGLQRFRDNQFDIVITDFHMPDMSGLDVLQEIRRTDRGVIIILVTAYGTVENAIEACRTGADDYITKPFSKERLLFIIEKTTRLRQLQRENLQLKQELVGRHRFEGMIARSANMENLLRMAAQVAASDATVLVLGESGTGKELLSRSIHYNSPRRDKPMVTINCPSIPDNLLESELFGHVKGAYTGAIKDRKGKFELAEGGTVFLDEIGDLRGEVQAKLLRVLQEHEFERLGESKPVKADVRIIAATHKNLELLVEQGLFRQDLFYRLSVVPLIIPPLRERKAEISYLVDFFVDRYGKGASFVVDPEALSALQAYNWPGNVRELENAIERAVVLSTDQHIRLANLPPLIAHGNSLVVQPLLSSGTDVGQPGPQSLEAVERQLIVQTLQRCGGNKSRAARELQIPRHVLLYRLKKWSIN